MGGGGGPGEAGLCIVIGCIHSQTEGGGVNMALVLCPIEDQQSCIWQIAGWLVVN